MVHNNNIFRVLTESDLDEIVQDNQKNLVMIMFSSQTCEETMKLKAQYVDVSNLNQDCFFVYVDLNDFIEQTHKYTKDIKHNMQFSFYFNLSEIGYVTGTKFDSFVNTLHHLKGRIEITKLKLEQEQLDKQLIIQSQLDQPDQTSQPSQPSHHSQPIQQSNLDEDNKPTKDQLQTLQTLQNMKGSLHMQQLMKIKQLEDLYKQKELEEQK
jgi:hypothetical protein